MITYHLVQSSALFLSVLTCICYVVVLQGELEWLQATLAMLQEGRYFTLDCSWHGT
jgi:uncharacterized membrane protein